MLEQVHFPGILSVHGILQYLVPHELQNNDRVLLLCPCLEWTVSSLKEGAVPSLSAVPREPVGTHHGPVGEEGVDNGRVLMVGNAF